MLYNQCAAFFAARACCAPLFYLSAHTGQMVLNDRETSMMSCLYIGATGLKTHSSGMQSLSHNLANANTVGYKQEMMLFDDLMYQQLPQGSTWQTSMSNQVGMGVQIGSVRTLFEQGAFEPGNTVTDLALSGRGFFQVTQDGVEHYTRAGNFRFDAEGVLRDPNGYLLSGIALKDGQDQGGLTQIKVNPADPLIGQNPARPSSSLTGIFNLGFTQDATSNAANPYFSLVNAWDGTSSTPLATSATGYAQPMRFYDAEGNPQQATIYFDGAPAGANGQRVFEYVVGINPELDSGALGATPGAGLVMAGTLTFSSNGELLSMSAFTPSGGDPKDLNNWVPAPLVNGQPQGTVSLPGLGAQALTINLGIGSGSNTWSNAPASAAAVGTDPTLLPSLAGQTRQSESTTAFGGSSVTSSFIQDGWPLGQLSDMNITRDGLVRCTYTNGQQADIYRIPVFRFTSEDGLRREGMNHFSATKDSGKSEYGRAGEENYGEIIANQIETSNVEMSREMVHMIIMQRGFQMNSKSVTTADTMLQRALELKR